MPVFKEGIMDSGNTAIPGLERNMGLINLAADCVFIKSCEKEEVIRLLEEKSKEDPDIDVLDIFKQENLVSDKRIEYLQALDAHLKLQSEDMQFGRLAVANGFCSADDVEKALRGQQNYFKKNKANKKIGDILVENKVICESVRISVLLTQNRIKDEQLLDAFNALGETQIKKDAVNKRFGVLAIKKEQVTLEQVNSALDIQKKERLAQGKSRFIGEILQEISGQSDQDILEILLEQKQFEKRRLDLERSLYTAQSELKISKRLNKIFDYHLSGDGLEVYVEKRMEPEEPILVYELIIWLRRVGIRFGIVEDAVLEEMIQKTGKKSKVLVAKGIPPRQCTHESIQLYFDNDSTRGQEKPDNAEPDNAEPDNVEPDNVEPDNVEPPTSAPDPLKPPMVEENPIEQEKKTHEPIFMKKGSLLARIIPGEKGKPGKDVLGHPILPDNPLICVLNAGNGVVKKGCDFLARIDGRPVLKNGTTLMVEPVVRSIEEKKIMGSISIDTLNTYESARVEMKGDLTREGILRCRSMVLHGSLAGCVVCTESLVVHGNIGIEKPDPTSDEILGEEAPDHQTLVTAQGTIKAFSSIVNSKIETDNDLLAVNSSVVGSQVTAYKGITIRDSLMGKTRPCVLCVGLKPGDQILTLDHTIETRRAELAILKKEDDIAKLTSIYERDLEEEKNHRLEQAILKNLIQIIEAPELYQYEELEGKIKYLQSLPDFSTVKSIFLKLPETKAGRVMVKRIVASVEKLSLDHVVEQFTKQMDPEPTHQTAVSTPYRSEMVFTAGMSSLESQIVTNLKAIETLETEIKGLQELRTTLGLRHVNSLHRSEAVIKVRNKCERGTIIKGIIARLVVEKTLYNVTFTEVMNPKTRAPSIAIDS